MSKIVKQFVFLDPANGHLAEIGSPAKFLGT